MRKSFIFIFFILVSAHLFGQKQNDIPDKPKLVIGIVIDQMRYDYIFRFWDKYENNGFKRLINEGSFCKNANFNYMLTQTSPGIATIATGANPSTHGIVSEKWYNQLTDKIVPCTYDEKAQCIGGASDAESNMQSASNLLASTIGDELKLATYKMAKVVSVSMDPNTAVLSAGHIADGAYWYDGTSGNFVTSSAYLRDLPQWVKDFNNKKFADTYLSQTWEKLLPDSLYFESLPDNNRYEEGIKGYKTFPYNMDLISKRPDGKRDYNILKYTPFGNNITKDFAISAIVNENLGKGKFTDYITVDFSSVEYISQISGITSVELEDAFLKLDKEIQHFLNFIDGYIGKGKVLVYVTSAHGAVHNPKFMTDLGVPSGYFNQGQAQYLLKSYLNVLHGKGEWVKFYGNQQLYLNHLLIEDSKLNLSQVQDEVAQFLLQFSGVTNTVTATMMQKTDYSNGIFAKMQNSFNQKHSGDVMINLEPGWTEYNDASTAHNSAYNYDTHVPLIFYGWKISRQVIYDQIDMTDIAPTIAMFLDIAYPNASEGKPITQLLK